jgi:hypothetical protein
MVGQKALIFTRKDRFSEMGRDFLEPPPESFWMVVPFCVTVPNPIPACHDGERGIDEPKAKNLEDRENE